MQNKPNFCEKLQVPSRKYQAGTPQFTVPGKRPTPSLRAGPAAQNKANFREAQLRLTAGQEKGYVKQYELCVCENKANLPSRACSVPVRASVGAGLWARPGQPRGRVPKRILSRLRSRLPLRRHGQEAWVQNKANFWRPESRPHPCVSLRQDSARIMASTAISWGMPLVTADRQSGQWSWAGERDCHENTRDLLQAVFETHISSGRGWNRRQSVGERAPRAGRLGGCSTGRSGQEAGDGAGGVRLPADGIAPAGRLL